MTPTELQIGLLKQCAVTWSTLWITWVHECTTFYLATLEDWR